ncbi:MAG: helix-turn-helix domain-containing protein [Phycisphaerae bacterium]|nr:helix-turn-helix domain-containing protein [Phycisphaerae bacterium]
MSKGKKVLTTGDVAKICNVAPRTVSKWFDSGQLKGYRIPGSKDRRIPVDELVHFMRLHNMPTDALASGLTRVLILDSDTEASHAMAQKLNDIKPIECQVVETSFEAGIVTERFSPHVMIVNLHVQGVDASRICQVIRSQEELEAIRMVALAGHLSESEWSALLQKGFDDYISDRGDIVLIAQKIQDAVAIIYQ